MKKRNVWLWFLAGMLAALLLAGIGFGKVYHATALTVEAAPTRVPLNINESSPAVIPAAAFSSDGLDPASMFFSFWSGYMGGGNINTCFKAPVYLPKGANMEDMWTSVYDNDPDANIWIRLFRVDNYSGVVDELAFVSTSSAADYIQTPWDWIDPTRNIVYYPQYSYYLGACAESNLDRLYSVRIYFHEHKVMMPIVLRDFGKRVVEGDSLPDANANQDVYRFSGTAGTHLDILVDTLSPATAFDIEACLSTEDSADSCFAFGDDQITCTYPPPQYACPHFQTVLPADGDGMYYLLIESGSDVSGYAGLVGLYMAQVSPSGYISTLELIHNNQPGTFKRK